MENILKNIENIRSVKSIEIFNKTVSDKSQLKIIADEEEKGDIDLILKLLREQSEYEWYLDINY